MHGCIEVIKGGSWLGMGMSGEGASPNKDSVKSKSEFQYVLEAMKGQWASMLGMAAMFVVTIGLGMLLQPFYNQSDELRAFGKEGASQGRWILLELAMIFVFTAIIIWLAKKKKEWIIKGGILVILWLALIYATVPLAHLVLAPDMSPDPFVVEDVLATSDDEFLFHLGTSGYMMYGIEPAINASGEQVKTDDNVTLYNHTLKVTEDGNNWTWSTQHTDTMSNLRVTQQDEIYVISDGSTLWVLDEHGQELDSDNCIRATNPAACTLSFNHIVDEENRTYSITHEPRMVRFHTNKALGNATGEGPAVNDGQWAVGEDMNLADGQLVSIMVSPGKLLTVDYGYAALMIVPEENTATPGEGGRGPSQTVEEIWNYSAVGNTNFTTVEWGVSPWAENNLSDHDGPMMLLLGTENGEVMAWNFDLENDVVEAEDRLLLSGSNAFAGSIDAIRLGDYGNGGWNDLFIAEGGVIHMLHGSNLVDYIQIEYEGAVEAIMVEGNDDGALVSWYQDGNWSSGQITNDMLTQTGIQLDNLSSLVGLIVSTVLMVWLIWRPEWYVVNTTGILVGSGVVVMLGVAFVPWLVIIFMILAAIYDHWAVHKSKHMLDLADTMIGLNLPILLVAPQEKGFSMLDDKEEEKPQDDESEDEAKEDGETKESSEKKVGAFKAKAVAAEQARVEKKAPPKNTGAEAMFMGLGDIIFPGMLVISAMTYLAPMGGQAAATWVAIGIIIGGLIGYMILMTRVALGIPQAGLPLLNGCSILAYLIFSVAFIGWKALEFNITL